jgi:hypothetical protein
MDGEYVPGAHRVQAVCLVVLAYVPAWQDSHFDGAPPGILGVEVEPPPPRSIAGEQPVHGTTDASTPAPDAVVYLPAAQSTHEDNP